MNDQVVWDTGSRFCGDRLVQYALAFSFYIYSLKYIRAGLAGMFLNLVPVIGVVGAVVFLGERLSLLQVGGAALTIIALVLIAKNAASENTLKDYIKK
ncbi:EamA family transporter [Pseudomonas helleri]|uniref:EamA family transporter n=1 Tax=Pseudomonas helleri TaxID=1608996 RepID=UPI003F963808